MNYVHSVLTDNSDLNYCPPYPEQMRVLTFRVFLILLISLLWGCPGPVAKLAPPEPSYVWADSVLSSLNLESKVGQMIMIDVASVGDITNSDDRSRFMQQMMQGRVGGLVLFAGQQRSGGTDARRNSIPFYSCQSPGGVA